MAFDPLYLFVFAGLFSPGPNVILLSASGSRFGFRATLPHVIGVAVGVGITSAAASLGIAALVFSSPVIGVGLRFIAALWIFWLAISLWRGRSLSGSVEQGDRKPFTVLEAVLFQWVNPKVWAVAIAAATGYPSGQGPIDEAVRLATAFAGINLGVCLFWAGAGSVLAFLLRTPKALDTFDKVMAVLLAVSGLLVFL